MEKDILSQTKPKKQIIAVRLSDEMLQRLKDACEREGIDKTSLMLSYIYQIVVQVEQGQTPELHLSSSMDDRNKNQFIQLRMPQILKQRFDHAITALNSNASDVLRSHLVHFVLDSESRMKI